MGSSKDGDTSINHFGTANISLVSSEPDIHTEQTRRNPTILTAENNDINIDTANAPKNPRNFSLDNNEAIRRSQNCSPTDKNELNADDEHEYRCSTTQGTESQSPEVQSGHTSESGNSLRDEPYTYIAPNLGLEFESEEHAYKCYNRYAAIHGFSIRKDFVNKSRVTGLVVSRRYTCHKQGHRPNKCNENSKKPRKEARTETRTGCFARMTISRQPNGRFKVTDFDAEHNHDFATPSTAHLLPSQKRLTFAEAVEAGIANDFINDGVPKLGMGFESEDDAYSFYNEYAAQVGFSVRKDYVNRSKVDGAVASRRFTCFREGHRQKERCASNIKRPRKETRIGCLARLIISRQSDGRFRVTHFEENHNHELVPACRVHLLRSQKSIRSLEENHNRTVYSTDHRNKLKLLSIRTREMEKEEEESVLEYFQRKQLKDSSFLYAIQDDVEDKMTNVFWADGKMLVDYGDFCDVVCFDTSSRFNKELQLRPFVFFAGVNHHKQMVVFGAALLYDETIESFKWLFRTFVKAMSMKKPKTILTDRDDVIAEAINQELPESHHRICPWQVYQNALRHLSKEITSFGSLAGDLRSCIFHHDEEEHFVNAWKTMMEMYNLCENEWLLQIFEERERWALPYSRYIFCADIQSAQLDESFNANMNKCFRSDLHVLQMFKNFGKAVNDLRYKEIEANYEMNQNPPRIMGDVVMLKHARDIYTPKLFESFQQEYENCLDFIVNRCIESESSTEFKVSVYGQMQKEYTVTYNSLEDSVVCNCMKFQFAGILCSHALKVLDYRNIKIVPSRYILKRWSRDAKILA